MDAHHGRAHAHTCHLGLKRALKFTRKVAHVGAGTAHVKTNHLVMAGGHCGAHHAHDAPSRAREDGVFALKALRLGQAARALHEEEAHTGHLLRHVIHVAAQDGAQISVHHRGVATRYQLHERAHFMRAADLRKTHLACEARRSLLMRREAPAVHENDGAGADARIKRRLQVAAQSCFVQWC